jgi:hypothetical protein
VSRFIDLTGGDRGLRKDTKTNIEKSWDWVGLTFLMRDMTILSAFIYTAHVRKLGEMQVEFSWVQLHRWQEQRSCGMLLVSTDYPD